MAIQMNTNASVSIAEQMEKIRNDSENTFSKLSSGKKINSAADDAAALSIMTEMEAQVRALSQAERNTLDGVSMVQTAEGAMAEMSDATIRMQELALQSANGTLSSEDRAAIDAEMSSLKEEVDRISATAEFNGQNLLDGSAGEVSLQVGTTDEDASQINVDFSTAMNTANLGTDSGAALSSVSAGTAEDALNSLSTIQAALSDISSKRSELGAVQNTLDTHQNNLSQTRVNQTEALSRIADTDVAEAATQSAKNQILMQSSSAVMAQATQLPAAALSLIG